MERFIYRLAAYHRIPHVEAWKRRVSIRQVIKWLAYWSVEPFGDDWDRTARQTLFLLKALGSDVDADLIAVFKPNYDPDREMTQDEIDAELTKFANTIPKQQ